MIRAPLAPSGCPIAMAPPLTLVRARSAPVSFAHVLTQAGTDLMPVVWAMFEWGHRYLEDTRLRLTHLGCGAEARVEIRCADDHVVPPDELGIKLGRRRGDGMVPA